MPCSFLFASRGVQALVLMAGMLLPARGAEPDSIAGRVLHSKRPLVIGHRGYSAIAPENTLPSFRRAVEAGADLVELDYHHSADGVLVVIHDYTLDRTTDATNRWGVTNVKVAERSAEEIRSLEAGRWFSPPYPETRIPTLAEALETIQPGALTLVERKAGDAEACVKLLRERNLLNHVIVQAFDWEYLRQYRRLEPQQILGALGPPPSRDGRKLSESEKILDAGWLDEIAAVGVQAVGWNRQITSEAVTEAHRRGLKVWVYTINDAATAGHFLNLGVDGIISDNPAIVWKALATIVGPQSTRAVTSRVADPDKPKP